MAGGFVYKHMDPSWLASSIITHKLILISPESNFRDATLCFRKNEVFSLLSAALSSVGVAGVSPHILCDCTCMCVCVCARVCVCVFV